MLEDKIYTLEEMRSPGHRHPEYVFMDQPGGHRHTGTQSGKPHPKYTDVLLPFRRKEDPYAGLLVAAEQRLPKHPHRDDFEADLYPKQYRSNPP